MTLDDLKKEYDGKYAVCCCSGVGCSDPLRHLLPKLIAVAESAERVRRGIEAAGHVLKGSALHRMLGEDLAALESHDV
jgi:hypothetical protein